MGRTSPAWSIKKRCENCQNNTNNEHLKTMNNKERVLLKERRYEYLLYLDNDNFVVFLKISCGLSSVYMHQKVFAKHMVISFLSVAGKIFARAQTTPGEMQRTKCGPQYDLC